MDWIRGLLDEEDHIPWIDTNRFVSVIDRHSKKIYAIRDYGRYLPEAKDFLFQTHFLLIDLSYACCREQIPDKSAEFLHRFETEVGCMKRIAGNRFPLFLLDYLGNNTYAAMEPSAKEGNKDTWIQIE